VAAFSLGRDAMTVAELIETLSALPDSIYVVFLYDVNRRGRVEEAIPLRLRRDLNNVASLLEIAQGVFDTVKDKRLLYIKEIQQKEQNPNLFLAQPLDFDTLIAYTTWKFPNLKASTRLTELLLRDLNIQKYPTLLQIDLAVRSADAAVDAYSKENPDWFKNGTDFVTKSLGFTDSEFRSKHGFATRTREAFVKYQNLVVKT
jgi:GTP pyrophosphokinase